MNYEELTKKLPVYVCGLLFNEDLTKILLIYKNRGPVAVKGKMNGVGGKVEQGEGFRSAIVREVFEETGVATDVTEWSSFWTYRNVHGESAAVCHFLTAKISSDRFYKYETMTDENVQAHEVVDLLQSYLNGPRSWSREYLVPNLFFLVPMALHHLCEEPLERNIGY